VFLMCDPRDLGVATQVRSPKNGGATIYIYDVFPGGVGLSPRLFQIHDRLMAAVVDLVDGCGCTRGCPSCIGALVERDVDARRAASTIARCLPGRLGLGGPREGFEVGAVAAAREA
jgi:DEAD/DEAH box helicase domain-containing protein